MDWQRVGVKNLEDEGLAQFVAGGIVEVLGGDGGALDSGKARIAPRDDVPLNELHPQPPPARASIIELVTPLSLAAFVTDAYLRSATESIVLPFDAAPITHGLAAEPENSC